MIEAGDPSEKEESTHRREQQQKEGRHLSVEVLWGVAGTSLQLAVVNRKQEEHVGT